MELSPSKLLSARGHHQGRKVLGIGLLMISPFTLLVTIVGLTNPASMEPNGRNGIYIFAALTAAFIAFGWHFCTDPVCWLCPGCAKRIHAKEQWRCGACTHENRKISWEGAHSFLGRCGNNDCQAKPSAYECQHCQHVMTLISGQDERNSARSLNTIHVPSPNPEDALRQMRTRELAEKEHNRQHLEADQKLLLLVIANARLRTTLKRPEPVEVTPRQERINWIADQLEEADLFCRTVPETVQRELTMHAEIDGNQYHPDANTDAHIKAQMKEAISVSFERIRLNLGGNIQVHNQDHRNMVR